MCLMCLLFYFSLTTHKYFFQVVYRNMCKHILHPKICCWKRSINAVKFHHHTTFAVHCSLDQQVLWLIKVGTTWHAIAASEHLCEIWPVWIVLCINIRRGISSWKQDSNWKLFHRGYGGTGQVGPLQVVSLARNFCLGKQSYRVTVVFCSIWCNCMGPCT